jgi:hypothetical protein
MSENILFLFENQFDTATVTSSSEAVGFPPSNLKNPFRTKVWRTLGGTPGTATLDIDLGSGTKSVNCVALTGYSWTAAPATLQLEFDDSADHGSPEHTETLTWAANPTVNGNYGTIIKTFTSKDERYIRLNVVYGPGDWDLGRIFIGNYFQPVKNYKIEWTENIIDSSIMSQSIGGQDHIDEIEKYRQFGFSFLISTQPQWELFQKMMNYVGFSKDLFIAFDYTNEPDEMTIYGKFTNFSAMTNVGISYKQMNLIFKESR